MSSQFRREALLNPEEEEELAEKMLPLWLERNEDNTWKYTGKQIAQILGFGSGKYRWLKPEYFYYYRRKLKLPKREKERFLLKRYKFGKQERPINYEEFYRVLEKNFPLNVDVKYRKATRRARAFNILCFYTGLRQGEIRRLRRRDFSITSDGELRVSAFRLKKIIRDDKKFKEAIIPIFLPLVWKYVDELIDYLKQFDEDELVFPITAVTAWKYVKALFPKGYPHYYRLNLITELANNPNISLVEIERWSGLGLQMIKHYLSRSERFAKTVAEKRKVPRVIK